MTETSALPIAATDMPVTRGTPPKEAVFLPANGEMARLIKEHDWSRSPLGAPDQWSQSLKTTVGLMLPAAAEIVLFWGPDFVALYNDAFAPTVGNKHPRALGRPARENWAELWDDLQPLLQRVRDTRETVFAKDRPFYIERHGYPETVYFNISYSAVPDETGAVGGVLCIVGETTQRVLNEQALRESDARLRAAVEASESGTFRWDIRTNELDWDEALDKLFGLAPGVTARSLDQFVALVHPDERQNVIERCQRCASEGADFEMEFRIVLPDGTTRWLYDRGKTFVGADGNPSYMTGACVDITERKLAGELRRESEDRLRLANEAADIGTWDFNPVTGELRWDERCKMLFGLPADANVTYESFLAGLHPEDRERTDRAVQEALLPDGPGQFNVRYRTVGLEDEIERWVAATGKTVFSGGGSLRKASRFIGTVIDISERVRAEQTLTALNETLESRVAEEIQRRSKAEDALRQTQKMETVGQLSGGIAHDFNNLLQIIRGNLSLLQRGGGPTEEKWRRQLANALTGTDRAAALTQRLLAFSRRQPLDPRPVDVNQLIGDMTELLHRTLGEPIVIETHLLAGIPAALVDGNQLENAILNLAINARDAMPRGGRLDISTDFAELERDDVERQPEAAPGRYVRISVRDTGVGMNPEVLDRALEPFFSTKEVGHGTGLGLSMVYGFVRQSGGHLMLQSREREGTSIELFLPCSDAAAEARSAGGSGEELPRGRGERVLLCEDDDDVRLFSSEALKDLGYDVLEARDATTALAVMLDHRPVDLLFTDVVLPGGKTGADLAREARKLQPGLKVLFTTGYARSALDKEQRGEKGLDLLLKPFGIEELAAKVREMVA
jgi:PAS domain S-box-containing protein